MPEINLSDTNRLVAHRGDHRETAENSLAAFRQALSSGAQWLECDVQLTRDALPVVFHDEDTRRMCQKDGKIAELSYDELPPLLDGQAIPRLEDLLALLSEYPQAKLFLEIKREILPYYSIEDITAKLSDKVSSNEKIIPISMSPEILEYWWQTHPQPLGWIPAGRAPDIPLAYLLMPAEDFLRGKRPAAAERIAVYTINNEHYARRLLEYGADLVETDHFSYMQNLMYAG